jgi:hypothetical protein
MDPFVSPVKTEAEASPDLLSSSFPSLQQFQFSFHSPQSHASSESDSITNNHYQSVFRFGSQQPYHLMPQSWPASPGPSRQSSSGAQMINGTVYITWPYEASLMVY